MTQAMAESAVGRVIDRYRLDAPLGSGGFGVVYRATHLVTGRAVALKLLRPEHLGSRELLDRFVREARAAAAIEHPAIVDVLDAGTTPDGEAFLAMELLDGETLEERLAREPALQTDQALAIAVGILDGLAAAHARGVIHRDLKPANVFLPRPGTTPAAVKLLDFGISKVTHSTTTPSLTRSGMILGTPHFMAPEQFSGSATVDARADLFAASVLFYVALTGEHPFATQGDDMSSLLVRVHTEPPKPLSELAPWLPAGLRHVIERGLARDPDGRWQSAAEYSKAVRALSTASTAEMAARMALRATAPSGPQRGAPTPQGDPFAATIATGQPTPHPTAPSGMPRPAAFPAPAPSAAPPPTLATPATAMHAGGPAFAPSTERSAPPAEARRGRWRLFALLGLLVAGGVGALVTWLVILPRYDGPGASDGVAPPALPIPVAQTNAPAVPLPPKPVAVAEAPKPTPVPAPEEPPTTPIEPAPTPDVVPPEEPEPPSGAAASVHITARPLGDGVPHDVAAAFGRRGRAEVARCASRSGPRSFRVTAVFNPEGQIVDVGPDAPLMGVEIAECAGTALESIGPLGAARGGIVFYQISFD